ncbi:hypothetical protein ACHHYP_12678 [Achlya hypogyna]|uniref:PHD-type domain-containing protein n=1 Tax=Achlya hypogyna TaxID=1202772 RepID=A0A1V9ZH50_ACHHY|nr:hypothetical protein ACHHYP_12678 [Achlya hypogyna]
MAERVDGELLSGKKRRAQDADKDTTSWQTASVSAGPAFVPKVRLGKRYQATIPPLKSIGTATDRSNASSRARKDDDDDEGDTEDDYIRMDTCSTEASPSIPRRMYSMEAIKGDKSVDKYLKFASSLCNGYMHGTPHATTANALHHLHRHSHDVVSAACHLYAAHGFAMMPEPRGAEDGSKKASTQKAKVQEWMVRALACIGHDVIDEATVAEMQELVRTCPTTEVDSKEMYVLQTTLARVEDWREACAALTKGKCTVADIQAVLYTAEDLRCALPERDVINARVFAFETAKSALIRGMTDRPKGRKAVKIGLDTLKELLMDVERHAIHFAQEDHLHRIIEDAEALEAQILHLLAQDKVSVPAVRDILARVEAIPVNLQAVVEPLKTKMVSAQKWLERARKCIPPTKRQSSRNMQDARTKMDLSTVHDLVKSAPIDEQSSEMQEMEELLAYADEWSARVADAIADSAAAMPIDTLRELLDEGHDMPVVMEQTAHLAAIIEGREWVDDARRTLAAHSSLDDLRAAVKEAHKLRKRMPPAARERWQPAVEADIVAAIAQAETWLGELHELLGSATCARLFTGDASRFRGPKHQLVTKPTVAAVQAKLAEVSALRVDVGAFVAPLEGLLGRCAELEALCATCLASVDGDQAFAKAAAALEAVDTFACYVAPAEQLRAAVSTAKEWLARVKAVCGAKPAGGRRLTKRSSTAGHDNLVPLAALSELQEQGASLVFAFPEEQRALAVELDSVAQWQARVRDWLRSDVPTIVCACSDLRTIDTQYVEQRRAAWEARQKRLTAARDTDAPKAVLTIKAKEETLALETAPEREMVLEADVARIAPLVHATDFPALESSVVVDIVRGLSGTRPKEAAEATATMVDWGPLVGAIDDGLAYIASLETRVKAEEADLVLEATPAEEAPTQALSAALAAVQELLGQANPTLATPEAATLHALAKLLEWFQDARAVLQGETGPSLPQVVATGVQLQAASDLPADAAWADAVFWSLPLLTTQHGELEAFQASLEERLSANAFALEDMDAAIAQADALQADDRPLWVELKKTKIWLAKVKKAVKPRAANGSRMPLHAATALVEDGAKLKVVAGAWTALQAHVATATAWEERLKTSGLDSGHAKIAVLVQLLHEYTHGGFLVDFDMHRDVLVSATEQYCICRQPYDGLMIGCDLCDDWFHDTCIGLSKEKAEKVEDYMCPSCGLLQELKALVDGIDGSTRQLFELEDKAHEKAFGVALRKVKKEERDVDKAHVAVMELQAQVTAIGQHVQYLEKIQEEAPPKFLPSLGLPFPQHPSPSHVFKPSPFAPSPLLRSPYPSTSASVALPPLQPLPSILSKANGLPPLLVDNHHGLYHPQPIQSKPAEALPSASAQEIELTRFKMEHYKLKQLAAEAEVTLEKGKERAVAARGGMDTLLANRDVLLPQAQTWWRMACAHLARLVAEKDAFDLKQLRIVAAMSEPFRGTFASVALMQKVLVAIPWTVEAVSLLHGRQKPAYEALDRVLNESVLEPKALAALRGVLLRTDTWVAKSKKIVAKLVGTGKKPDAAKLQVVANEYMKMPLTCPWGSRLQAFLADLADWEAAGATPVLMPTLAITPPSSPVAAAPKRKASGKAGGSAGKRAKGEGDVQKRSKAKGGKTKAAKICEDDTARVADTPPPATG